MTSLSLAILHKLWNCALCREILGTITVVEEFMCNVFDSCLLSCQIFYNMVLWFDVFMCKIRIMTPVGTGWITAIWIFASNLAWILVVPSNSRTRLKPRISFFWSGLGMLSREPGVLHIECSLPESC